MLLPQFEIIQELLIKYRFNLLNCICIVLTVIFVLFDILLNNKIPKLPSLLWLSCHYGKLNHKEVQNTKFQKYTVPKSWFAHFYVFALALSLLVLGFTLNVVTSSSQAPDFVVKFLDFVAGGKTRTVYVSSTNGLIAIFMMTMQCARRFYESNFLQIFSKKGKLNLSVYFSTYLFYFTAIVSTISNTEGFVRGTTASIFSLSKVSLMQYLCFCIFYYSWTHQHRSNMILVNLRKDKNDNKVTESHLIPNGGFFEVVSSPHMFFEVCMYTSILGILPNFPTWQLITSFVIINQTLFGWLTHKWYKENFKNYPTTRYAIYPYIL